MPQASVSAPASAPATPAAPQRPGRDFGDAIRDAVDEALEGAFVPARNALVQEIAKLKTERDQLQAALSHTPNRTAQREIERQIARLDNRIHDAEQGLEKIEARLSSRDLPPPTTNVGQAPHFPDRPMPDFDPTPIVATSLGILFVAFPLTLAIVRFIWKRSTSAPAPALNIETARRFDRLEQSVDAIAIEIERISENQRYLTRLLADPKQNAKIGG